MNITIREPGDTLNLSAHPGIVLIDRWRWRLIWDRHGVRRRVPTAVIADAARVLADRAAAPERFVAKWPDLWLDWDDRWPTAPEPSR